MSMKKVICLSDLQCGHVVGLTPPEYNIGGEWGNIQNELWEKYSGIAAKTGKADVLLLNGDLIEGKGEMSGGTELITSDRHIQLSMAERAIGLFVGPKTKIIASIGTGYHCGKSEDFERELIVNRLGGIADDAPFVDVNGVIFGMKHYSDRSSVPYSRGTPLGKEVMWNFLSAAIDEQPWCDIILRSHTHYYYFVGQEAPNALSTDEIIGLLKAADTKTRDSLIRKVQERANTPRQILAFATPSLQAAHTKFGKRIMSGTTNWGLLEFNVDGGEYSWTAHLARLRANKSNVIRVQ